MAKRSTPRGTRGARPPGGPPASEPASPPTAQAQAVPPDSPGFKAGRLDEATLRRFVFRTFGRSRRTQDSPVMPDVWLRYIRLAEAASNRLSPANDLVDLLLTPWSAERPGEI